MINKKDLIEKIKSIKEGRLIVFETKNKFVFIEVFQVLEKISPLSNKKAWEIEFKKNPDSYFEGTFYIPKKQLWNLLRNKNKTADEFIYGYKGISDIIKIEIELDLTKYKKKKLKI